MMMYPQIKSILLGTVLSIAYLSKTRFFDNINNDDVGNRESYHVITSTNFIDNTDVDAVTRLVLPEADREELLHSNDQEYTKHTRTLIDLFEYLNGRGSFTPRYVISDTVDQHASSTTNTDNFKDQQNDDDDNDMLAFRDFAKLLNIDNASTLMPPYKRVELTKSCIEYNSENILISNWWLWYRPIYYFWNGLVSYANVEFPTCRVKFQNIIYRNNVLLLNNYTIRIDRELVWTGNKLLSLSAAASSSSSRSSQSSITATTKHGKLSVLDEQNDHDAYYFHYDGTHKRQTSEDDDYELVGARNKYDAEYEENDDTSRQNCIDAVVPVDKSAYRRANRQAHGYEAVKQFRHNDNNDVSTQLRTTNKLVKLTIFKDHKFDDIDNGKMLYLYDVVGKRVFVNNKFTVMLMRDNRNFARVAFVLNALSNVYVGISKSDKSSDETIVGKLLRHLDSCNAYVNCYNYIYNLNTIATKTTTV
ncbi:hypothetical protein HT594_00009 [Phenacoccus solenopsis nudivirus]|nr:hypothetical protein HT594_00009 [Phenacoccus solenopsis nudivirus]